MISRGTVYLGTKTGSPLVFPAAAQFTNDPKVTRDWPPRRSRLAGIGGSVTQQDFGRWAADIRLTLTSDGNYINGAFKKYLEGLMFIRGQSYDYKDYQGIEGTVIIVDFIPKPTFVPDRAAGLTSSSRLWEYTLTLDVLSLTKLDGVAYTGN